MTDHTVEAPARLSRCKRTIRKGVDDAIPTGFGSELLAAS